jgi:hypothetical protein
MQQFNSIIPTQTISYLIKNHFSIRLAFCIFDIQGFIEIYLDFAPGTHGGTVVLKGKQKISSEVVTISPAHPPPLSLPVSKQTKSKPRNPYGLEVFCF